MAETKKKKSDLPTKPIPPHRILREIFRHYLEYRALVMSPTSDASDDGRHSGVISHGYWVYKEVTKHRKGQDGWESYTAYEKDYKVNHTLSFWDLMGALKPQSEGGILSDRKREAVFYNVILDWKQKDVAEKMRITTVSVGQYVEQAMIALAKNYFAEDNNETR